MIGDGRPVPVSKRTGKVTKEEAERSFIFKAAAMLAVLLILTLIGTVIAAGYMAFASPGSFMRFR